MKPEAPSASSASTLNVRGPVPGGGPASGTLIGVASGVGSLEWARRTHGRLSARDRAALIAGGARRQARSMLPLLGVRPAAALDLDGYRPPDTAAAREAEEACREASPPFLKEHCYRTHLWGVTIARAEGVEHDEEAFYVAALTHDLGLTDGYRGHDPEAACFSLDSASGARELVERHGWVGGGATRCRRRSCFTSTRT
jgi:hypothetical protein